VPNNPLSFCTALLSALAITLAVSSPSSAETASPLTSSITTQNQLDHDKEAPPEAASEINDVKFDSGNKHMVVTANPHATKAAEKILKQGGNALDAAIAAQMMLGLVEPQSSGIGGGGFLLYWNNTEKTLSFYDGRETAPAAVNENYFLDTQKQPIGFFEAIVGAYSVGVPGVLAMFDMAHKEQGSLPWKQLFSPAIDTAENGFALSPRLHTLIKHTPKLKSDPKIKEYLFDEHGSPLPVDTVLFNEAYANTLQSIANNGSQAFYNGEIAKSIISAVQNDYRKPGVMTLEDLQNYQPKKRQALCRPYRQYNVCGAAPPSSGASTILSILGVLENYPITELKPDSTKFIHLFAEASNLAFADRNTYVADPDFVKVPLERILNKDYLFQRAEQIQQQKAQQYFLPGLISGLDASPFHEATSPELLSTTHLSIVDSQGNAVSMTSSIENAFGGRLMVEGFFLNNQLSDFSFLPSTSDNQDKIANRIEANKRPRSSMSPTIIFSPEGELFALTGSPGGSRIIDYTALSIIHLIDWQHSAAEAVSAAHIIARNNRKLELEDKRFDNKTFLSLKLLGHSVTSKVQSSGLHIITSQRHESGEITLSGAADPRREGTASSGKE